MESLYDIKAIEQGLRDIMLMIPQKGMPDLFSALKNSVEKLNQPMQLAIIGKISSSKSTLVNGILGKEEVMATGQKEVTYNVGWLKYGRNDADIIIHHKDGTPDTVKDQKEFARWSVEDNSSEVDNIRYIETFNDAEILKDINIIDTPGLDALRGKDSQNTLDFIREVRPDAVIMLFTHSVSENVLDIVSQYNAGSSFNPLNAIGILSKIDVLWQEDFERKQTALKIGQRMASNRIRKNAMIRKTLFNIYPISALLFLVSSTFNEEQLNDLKHLYDSEGEALRQAMKSVSKFVSNISGLTLDVTARENLIYSIGLYGVYLVLEEMKNNPDITCADVKRLFYKESGAQEFMKVLHNHFGMRAKLIKIESIYQNLSQTIRKQLAKSTDECVSNILYKIQQKLNDLFSSLVYEHYQYEMLNKIYNGELELESDTEKEFLNICGEHGSSAPELLGMEHDFTCSDLIAKATERLNYWRKCVALEPDPDEREWMNVILNSYSQLRQKLIVMNFQYSQSKSFLYNE